MMYWVEATLNILDLKLVQNRDSSLKKPVSWVRLNTEAAWCAGGASQFCSFVDYVFVQSLARGNSLVEQDSALFTSREAEIG